MGPHKGLLFYIIILLINSRLFQKIGKTVGKKKYDGNHKSNILKKSAAISVAAFARFGRLLRSIRTPSSHAHVIAAAHVERLIHFAPVV